MLILRSFILSALVIFTAIFWVPSLLAGDAIFPPFNSDTMPGWIVWFLGLAIMLWCVGAFAFIGRGTPAPFDPPIKFVARGPYRYVRNPMYIGGVIAILGQALVRGSSAVVWFSAIFWVFFHFFVTLYEEPNLKRRFGGEYEEYFARVSRWLPFKKP